MLINQALHLPLTLMVRDGIRLRWITCLSPDVQLPVGRFCQTGCEPLKPERCPAFVSDDIWLLKGPWLL